MATFHQLWSNHPSVTGEPPLLNTAHYSNQCAVRLYAAFQRSGVNLYTFRGQLSWQKNTPKYAIRAQELADWLAWPGGFPFVPIQKFSGKEVFGKIQGKRGIIFFQNFWGPGHQGDHIDLWNGSRLTDWFSWVRIHARIGSVGIHSISQLSDFEAAESVWFWPIS